MLCIFSSLSLVFRFINSHLSSQNHSPPSSQFSLYLFCFSKPLATICTPSLKFIFNFLSPSQFLPHLSCSLSFSSPSGNFLPCAFAVFALEGSGEFFLLQLQEITHILAHAHTCMHACTHIGWISDCSTHLVLGGMHNSTVSNALYRA